MNELSELRDWYLPPKSVVVYLRSVMAESGATKEAADWLDLVHSPRPIATVLQLLTDYTPPISIVEHLGSIIEEHGATPEAAAWLAIVVKVRSGESIPEIDNFGVIRQPELIKGPVEYA